MDKNSTVAHMLALLFLSLLNVVIDISAAIVHFVTYNCLAYCLIKVKFNLFGWFTRMAEQLIRLGYGEEAIQPIKTENNQIKAPLESE